MHALPPTLQPSIMAAPKPLLHLPYAYVMVISFSLAVLSLFVCVFVGVALHLDVSTRTHCKVCVKGRKEGGRWWVGRDTEEGVYERVGKFSRRLPRD